MNFSNEIKSEITAQPFDNVCCRMAVLSAIIRTSGSIFFSGGQAGVEIAVDNVDVLEFIVSNFEKIYSIKPSEINAKGNSLTLNYKGDRLLYALSELGIVKVEEGRLSLSFSIKDSPLENNCCLRGYILGAFLGSGSVTLPLQQGGLSGYHLEFIFSTLTIAEDFISLLCKTGINLTPKIVRRKDKCVVYLKNSQQISDLIAFFGASSAVLKLNDVIVSRAFVNNLNRRCNCDYANIGRGIEASQKQLIAIESLKKHKKFSSLKDELKEIATLREDNPEDSMQQLADKLGITKSCANHRMRKIIELAKEKVNG